MPYGQPSGHRKFKRKTRRRAAATSTVVVYEKKPAQKRAIEGAAVGAPQRTVSGKDTEEKHVWQEGKRVRR